MATGRCLCGEVRYALEPPLPEVELCHCRKCRKAYGAPYAATLYARRERFRWLEGADRVAVYDAPLEASPPAYRHSFCRRCGAPLPLLWDAPFVEVPVASLPRHERAAPLGVKVLRALFNP